MINLAVFDNFDVYVICHNKNPVVFVVIWVWIRMLTGTGL
uniref:Uncharacterized protein n=1 Tax=uncultured Desulfobacterium sp. TaxID=201089 RepID=E1YA19_9BACT|nr:unknown protein [uncultured Desulfobacterium sp.]